jgi:type II secretory pathway component PulJ
MRFNFDSMSSLDRLVKSFRHLVKSPRGRTTSGLMLPEVIVASCLMLIVVSVAGNGLVQFLRTNYRANVDSELRNNANRTLEFISNEVRRARIIADSPTRITSTRIPSGGRAILAFQVPDPANPSQPLPEQVVYYVQNRVNPWLGSRVLWRFGPTLDMEGNYRTPENINSWVATPVMDMVVDETDNTARLGCDPYTNSSVAGWHRFPADDSQVEGIYSCVREGGGQVILAANVGIELTTNDSSNYALSTKVSTRAVDTPFFLRTSIGGDPSDTTPAFSLNGPPNEIVLTGDATVETTILDGPPGICRTGCSVVPRNLNNLTDRFTRDLISGSTTTVLANAGDQFAIYVQGRSNSFGNNRNQTVNLYTAGQTIPSNLPNVTLGQNQVLVVIRNLRTSPTETYVVLVNIIPRRT